MGIDKKILKGGWQTKESPFPRGYFNTQMNQLDTEARPFPLRKEYKCKKNKGEHSWVHVPPNCAPGERTYPNSQAQEKANLFQPNPLNEKYQSIWSISRGATVFQCSACGKIDIRWNPRT